MDVVESLKTVSEASNMPLTLLGLLSRRLRKTTVCGDLMWWQIDSHVAHLVDILSKAERIKGTPVPLSYSRHASRFVTVYAFTLPMALNSFDNLVLLPLTVGFVAWVIFATEEITSIIEQPFGRGLVDDPDKPSRDQIEVLPLGRYCAEIAADVAGFSKSPRGVTSMPGAEVNEQLLFDEAA
eukprot:scaffold7339_cov249-Pinguiococcus_pyrenoidosus.AAC.17